MRVGGWRYLRWKHVIPLKDDKKDQVVAAAKLIVYGDDNDEYYSFITPEAYFALKEYMDFRASYGERITARAGLCAIHFGPLMWSREKEKEKWKEKQKKAKSKKERSPETLAL